MCASMGVYAICMGASGGHKRVSDPLELEFPPDVWAVNQAGFLEPAGSDVKYWATSPALQTVF